MQLERAQQFTAPVPGMGLEMMVQSFASKNGRLVPPPTTLVCYKVATPD